MDDENLKESNPGGEFTPRSGDNIEKAFKDYRREGNRAKRYLFVRNICHEKKVLDYGCGYGFGYLFLNRGCESYTGIDIDEHAIQWARKYLNRSNSNFYTVDEYLATSNKVLFDVTISFEVIEHLKDPSGYLDSLNRMTKNGGIIIISTPNGLWSHGERNLFRTQYHIREYNPEELRELLDPLGWQITFYKECRRDGLDYRGFKIMHEGGLNNAAKNHIEDLSVRQSLRRQFLELGWRFGNYPVFWKIVESKFEEMNSLDYSTIVVKIRKPY